MFALQYSRTGSPDVLTLGPATEPHAGDDQVRIVVRATGVSPTDAKLRSGELRVSRPLTFPHITGLDAAGVVDEVGRAVTGVAVGDEVFGAVPLEGLGGAAAEFAVLEFWEHKPASLSWAEAGAAGTSVETATRALDALAVTRGQTLLVDGAAGGVGSVVVQLATALGARVIGTGSPANHAFLAGLGATPVAYGANLTSRVASLAPDGVDVALDVAGAGSLADLVAITGSPERVLTIADFSAQRHGVRLSWSGSGDPHGRHGLATAAALAAEGRFHLPLRAILPLERGAEAHALAADGHGRGKVVLVVAPEAGAPAR